MYPNGGRLGEVDDYFWKTPNETFIEDSTTVTLDMPCMDPNVYNAVVEEAELEDESEDWENFKDIGLTT